MHGGSGWNGNTSKGAAQIDCRSAGVKCCSSTQRLQCAPVPGMGTGAGDEITAKIKTPGTIARDDIVHSAAARRDCALANGSGFGTFGVSSSIARSRRASACSSLSSKCAANRLGNVASLLEL